MPNCEMVDAGRTQTYMFMGKEATSCPNAGKCPYKKGLVFEFDGYDHSICRKHGQIKKPGRISLERIASDIPTIPQSQLSVAPYTEQSHQPA